MLREFCADFTTFLSAGCVWRGERLRRAALRWNARAKWLADVAEWCSTHRTWQEIRRHGGGDE